MAILGSFEEVPAPEAFSAAGQGTGVFIANIPPTSVCEIFLQGGAILGFRENGVLLHDLMRLHARFTELLVTRCGFFEFRRVPDLRVEEQFRFPLDQMIVSGLACAEELATAPDVLPEPGTVFERSGLHLEWLSGELQMFWDRAIEALRAGASAEALARHTNTSVPKAQWYLHKLQLAGLVRPRLPQQQRVLTPRLPSLTPRLDSPRLAPAPPRSAPPTAPPAASCEDPVGENRPVLRQLMDGIATFLR